MNKMISNVKEMDEGMDDELNDEINKITNNEIQQKIIKKDGIVIKKNN